MSSFCHMVFHAIVLLDVNQVNQCQSGILLNLDLALALAPGLWLRLWSNQCQCLWGRQVCSSLQTSEDRGVYN